MKKEMTADYRKRLEERGVKIVEKLSIPEEAILNSPFIIKKIEAVRALFKEHPFPLELWRAR